MTPATGRLIEFEQLRAVDDADMGHFVELRRGSPQLACVRCDASDLSDQPFQQCPGFDLHLLD
ncbi:hypothetical protein ACRQ5Q_07925 [Bradyrhizobium sp. PMVTL-01]|uniref:hypothetical protein n=1 Tax=Bradyrhizobium sp. PMVTL-01 TaxID=3434999 RepID=UPI003F713F60